MICQSGKEGAPLRGPVQGDFDADHEEGCDHAGIAERGEIPDAVEAER